MNSCSSCAVFTNQTFISPSKLSCWISLREWILPRTTPHTWQQVSKCRMWIFSFTDVMWLFFILFSFVLPLKWQLYLDITSARITGCRSMGYLDWQHEIHRLTALWICGSISGDSRGHCLNQARASLFVVRAQYDLDFYSHHMIHSNAIAPPSDE